VGIGRGASGGVWPPPLMDSLRPGLSMVRAGLKDRARPAVRVLDPAPP
jgi:hypothetical protein